MNQRSRRCQWEHGDPQRGWSSLVDVKCELSGYRICSVEGYSGYLILLE